MLLHLIFEPFLKVSVLVRDGGCCINDSAMCANTPIFKVMQGVSDLHIAPFLLRKFFFSFGYHFMFEFLSTRLLTRAQSLTSL